jgi:hypothetical protein
MYLYLGISFMLHVSVYNESLNTRNNLVESFMKGNGLRGEKSKSLP